MKPFLLLAALCLCGAANATNYYFSSSSGDDSRTAAQAQNPATPWKTISKLNSYFSTLAAGDSVLFKRDDVFYGSITVNKSGTATNPIKLGAYGAGAKPTITGFTTVASWTSVGTNLWESTTAVSTLTSMNVLQVNGANVAMGRLPKTGYWTIGGTDGHSITDNTNLNSSTRDWTGAQVVMRKHRWITDKYPVETAAGATIYFTSSDDDVQPGWGYFIQNDIRTLTVQNDWCFNATTRKVNMYSSSTPSNIQVPTIEVGVHLNNRDYINFDNINFTGYNSTGINTTSRTGIVISNCSFSFMGIDGIYAYPNSNNLKVINSSFTHCNSRGIYAGSSSNAFINGNTLQNIGHFAGMGGNGDNSYSAIISNGDNSEVSFNKIVNAGYVGIRWDGNATVIKNNFINTTNYVKDDGGGIYCYPNQLGPVAQSFTQRTVRDNIVLNAIGAIAGGTPSSGNSEGYGIYNDGTSPNVDYVNNTVANCQLGLFLNNGHEINVTGNSIFDCARGLYLIKYSSVPISNINVTNNIFVSKAANQYTAYYEPGAATMPADFNASSNYYARPIDDNKTIWQDVNGTNVFRTLNEWKTATGEDVNSLTSPKIITTVYDLRFIYNETNTTKTINLGANYLDVKNVPYQGTITLAPFASAILIKNDLTNIPPVADAGVDQTVVLPISVNLPGAGIDYDGTIASYSWTKVSGPLAGTITGATTANAILSGLATGVYKYELKVTDNKGAIGRDTITVNFGNVIVPVTMLKFTAVQKGNNSLLQWQTATEINSDHFEVERSTDGRNFIIIGTVRANGFTSSIIDYQLTDYSPEMGMNYYRLKIVDRDGLFQYSEIAIVNFKSTKSSSLNIINLGANFNQFTMNINSSIQQTVNYGLFDAGGKLLLTETIVLKKGPNSINKSLIASTSLYYMRMIAENEKISLPFINGK